MNLNSRYSLTGYFEVLFITLILIGLYLVGHESFLFLHSIVEITGIIIIGAVFLITWNSRNYLKNSYLLFLGTGFLFVAFIDFVHVIGYKGMGVFLADEVNVPAQLWIAARYLQAVSFFIAPFMLGREVDMRKVFSAYSVVTALIFASIYMGYFPDAIIEGSVFTPFKTSSEYVISLVLLFSFLLLRKHKEEFDDAVYGSLSAAIILAIFAELASSFNTGVYGFTNLAGHYFKLLSSYLIYRAIVVISLSRPYDLLYRELKIREYELVKNKEAQEHLLETLGLVNQILRHDILNDLNVISLSIGNLREDKDDRMLDHSYKAVQHSLKLINDMKDFESLMHVRGLKTIDLRGLAEEVAQEFPITVNVHGECSVKADSGLHSVVGNIIQNAMVHGKANKVDISISSKKDFCEMRISDNGTGIPDSIKEHVFEEGFKHGPSGHTGIGLYIAKRIIDRYGEISVEDNIPTGTTFILKLYHRYVTCDEKENESEI